MKTLEHHPIMVDVIMELQMTCTGCFNDSLFFLLFRVCALDDMPLKGFNVNICLALSNLLCIISYWLTVKPSNYLRRLSHDFMSYGVKTKYTDAHHELHFITLYIINCIILYRYVSFRVESDIMWMKPNYVTVEHTAVWN